MTGLSGVPTGQPLSRQYDPAESSLLHPHPMPAIRESREFSAPPALTLGANNAPDLVLQPVDALAQSMSSLRMHGSSSGSSANKAAAKNARAKRHAQMVFVRTATGHMTAHPVGQSGAAPQRPTTGNAATDTVALTPTTPGNGSPASHSAGHSPSHSESAHDSPASPPAAATACSFPAAGIATTPRVPPLSHRRATPDLHLPLTPGLAVSARPASSPLVRQKGLLAHSPSAAETPSNGKTKEFKKIDIRRALEDQAGCCSSSHPASKYSASDDINQFVLENPLTEKVIIDDCDLNAGTLEILEHLRSLAKLTIRNCAQLTDTLFATLFSKRTKLLHRLQVLDLSNTPITNVTLHFLHTHTIRLEALNISKTQVTDLSKLSGYPLFKHLDISDCPLIRDSHLDALASVQTHSVIETLRISGCAITDVGLLHLSRMRVKRLFADRIKPVVTPASFLPVCLGGTPAITRQITYDGIVLMVNKQVELHKWERKAHMDPKEKLPEGTNFKELNFDHLEPALSHAQATALADLLKKYKVKDDLPEAEAANEGGVSFRAFNARDRRLKNRATLSKENGAAVVAAISRENSQTGLAAAAASPVGGAAPAAPLQVQGLPPGGEVKANT